MPHDPGREAWKWRKEEGKGVQGGVGEMQPIGMADEQQISGYHQPEEPVNDLLKLLEAANQGQAGNAQAL
jgi:hypothetical protein